jgi:hypothetical protein
MKYILILLLVCFSLNANNIKSKEKVKSGKLENLVIL